MAKNQSRANSAIKAGLRRLQTENALNLKKFKTPCQPRLQNGSCRSFKKSGFVLQIENALNLKNFQKPNFRSRF